MSKFLVKGQGGAATRARGPRVCGPTNLGFSFTFVFRCKVGWGLWAALQSNIYTKCD